MDNQKVVNNLGTIGRKIMSMPSDKRNQEIAYWAISQEAGFYSQLLPVSLPHMPLELKEYYAKRRKGEKMEISKEFWEIPNVKQYMIVSRLAENFNKTNYEWMQTLYSYLPKEDVVNRENVKRRGIEFKQQIDQPHHDFPIKVENALKRQQAYVA